MPKQYNTRTLNPKPYRAWIERCAAQGINPLPAHSVTDNGCWALVKPNKPRPSGHIAICRSVNGKIYQMNLHTLSLLYANAPGIFETLDDMLAQGKRPMACHKPICGGNKACYNPSHLRLDDEAGNNRDRQRDGGYARGEANGGAKLTAAQVNAIRQEHSDGASQSALGRKYGVHHATIARIVKRKKWAHTDGKLF